MLGEYREAKRFLGLKFGLGERVEDGIYAIPTTTKKGDAFMKMEFKNDQTTGKDNFTLFWDEALTVSWYDKEKPEVLIESDFSKAYREVLKHI